MSSVLEIPSQALLIHQDKTKLTVFLVNHQIVCIEAFTAIKEFTSTNLYDRMVVLSL